MVRWIGIALVVVVAALGFASWKHFSVPPEPASNAGGTMSGEASGEAHGPTDPGVHWTVPKGWSEGPQKPMRVATYLVDGTECAVFWFGPGQGGTVDENIDRWAGQFEERPNPVRDTRTIAGLRVTRVAFAGTFLVPGPDMQATGREPGWKMLGALVDGPEGMVFFKMTGPAAAIDGVTADFDAMLASLTSH